MAGANFVMWETRHSIVDWVPEMERVASTLATEYIASTTGVTDTVATDSSLRKRKSSGSLQSPRAKAGMRNSSAG